MKFRQGITVEQASSQWLKLTVEVEESDLEASSAEMSLVWSKMTTMQRFNFARYLTATLLYSSVVQDYPLAEPELIEARTRFKEYVTKLKDSGVEVRDE